MRKAISLQLEHIHQKCSARWDMITCLQNLDFCSTCVSARPLHEQRAQAIWTAGNNEEPYVYDLDTQWMQRSHMY